MGHLTGRGVELESGDLSDCSCLTGNSNDILVALPPDRRSETAVCKVGVEFVMNS